MSSTDISSWHVLSSGLPENWDQACNWAEFGFQINPLR